MFLRNRRNDSSDNDRRNLRDPNRFAATRTSSTGRSNFGRTSQTPRGRNFRRTFNVHAVIIGAIFLIVGAIGAIVIVGYFQTNTYDNCVVAGKDRTTNSEGQSEMRVYTENCGTFTIGDDWFRGNFNTADMYGSLNEGDTYTFQATGFRIGILSMFPNIVSIAN